MFPLYLCCSESTGCDLSRDSRLRSKDHNSGIIRVLTRVGNKKKEKRVEPEPEVEAWWGSVTSMSIFF